MATVTGPGDIVLTEEQFTLLWTYLDREYRLISDPAYIGETVKIGEKLWAIVREVGEEQGFTPPAESMADPDVLRPSAWSPRPSGAAKSRSSSRRAK